MSANSVSLEFFAPAEELREYVTTYHLLKIDTHGSEPIRDQLHPEWGNIRFFFKGEMRGATIGEELAVQSAAVLVGPMSHATVLEASRCEVFSIGLLPLGWAALIGENASHYADQAKNLGAVVGDDKTAALVEGLRTAQTNAARVAMLDQFLLRRLGSFNFDRARILKVHAALTNPKFRSVGELEKTLDLTHRQFELTAKTVFGFGPNKLLRSQRFARTFGKAMLAPESEWAAILDLAYYDHAHFIRDFKKFMGMTPTDYMTMPHPVTAAGIAQRAAFAGSPMQVLHKPADAEDDGG